MSRRGEKTKNVGESSRPKQRARRTPNEHDIVFESLEHQKRYAVHIKRKLTPTRYMCNGTLQELGLQAEVHRMFHTLGMLEFMQLEAPTFARITLEFLSTIDFKLKNRWNGIEKEYYGTLHFRLFNTDLELTVEELGRIIKLPTVGPGAVPDTFVPAEFWTAITGNNKYVSKGAKASGIHNSCFRYAQKALAYTIFGRGDSTGVATQRELFFLYSMTSQAPINVAAFAADYLRRVGRAT